MHFQVACSGFVICICTIKFMICPAEKTSISLGLLAFSKYVYRTLAEEWGHLLSSCLKRNSIAHLVTVDMGAVLGPSSSFRGHCSSHNSRQMDLICHRPSSVHFIEDLQGLSSSLQLVLNHTSLMDTTPCLCQPKSSSRISLRSEDPGESACLSTQPSVL